MKVLLLSGGSGKRLWPLSNEARSKQFLRILRDSSNSEVSMVEKVWRQLKSVGLDENAIIATSSAQVDMIKKQLGDKIPLIVEPFRRDTFPAIALASSYLYSNESVSLNEVITVLPVDPFVDDAFFQTVKSMENILNKTEADLGLIGVKPTYPSSKYGYIIPGSKIESIDSYQVSSFHEKPTEEEALDLISNEALWNTGVFSFKLSYIINLLKEKGLPTDYSLLLSQYSEMPKISFDYEVVEKAKKVLTVPYYGYWKDLGTWNTLTEEMNVKVVGKGLISEDSTNTHIINELDIPIAALGLENIVVAASPDGILVTEKSASPRIKELLKDHHQRPMFEERRWGWYQVIDYKKYDNGKEMLTKRLSVLANKNISYQYHETRNEVWTVVDGQGEFVLDDKIFTVHSGDVLRIPARARHSLRAITSMEIIEVQTGSNLVEDDNFRVLESWEEIMNHCLAVK